MPSQATDYFANTALDVSETRRGPWPRSVRRVQKPIRLQKRQIGAIAGTAAKPRALEPQLNPGC